MVLATFGDRMWCVAQSLVQGGGGLVTEDFEGMCVCVLRIRLCMYDAYVGMYLWLCHAPVCGYELQC